MIDILIRLQGTILIYIFMGFLLRKTKMIDGNSSQFLSKFVLEFILPINIFYSCLTSFTLDTLKECLMLLLLAIAIESCIYLVTSFMLKNINQQERRVIRYGLLVSNGGLIGTPVIEGLYGASGVVYANIFLVPQRFLAYVAGEGIFNPYLEKKTFHQMILSIVTNKVVIALCGGIFIAVLPISLPLFLMNALQGVSRCMSPLSLILVGSILAEKFHLDIHEDIKIVILSCMRQLVIPLLVLLVVKQMNLDTMVQSIVVLLVGMPIASTTAIYAHKYHNGDGFASKAVFISTLSSIITLVILMGIIEYIL